MRATAEVLQTGTVQHSLDPPTCTWIRYSRSGDDGEQRERPTALGRHLSRSSAWILDRVCGKVGEISRNRLMPHCVARKGCANEQAVKPGERNGLIQLKISRYERSPIPEEPSLDTAGPTPLRWTPR